MGCWEGVTKAWGKRVNSAMVQSKNKHKWQTFAQELLLTSDLHSFILEV